MRYRSNPPAETNTVCLLLFLFFPTFEWTSFSPSSSEQPSRARGPSAATAHDTPHLPVLRPVAVKNGDSRLLNGPGSARLRLISQCFNGVVSAPSFFQAGCLTSFFPELLFQWHCSVCVLSPRPPPRCRGRRRGAAGCPPSRVLRGPADCLCMRERFIRVRRLGRW